MGGMWKGKKIGRIRKEERRDGKKEEGRREGRT